MVSQSPSGLLARLLRWASVLADIGGAIGTLTAIALAFGAVALAVWRLLGKIPVAVLIPLVLAIFFAVLALGLLGARVISRRLAPRPPADQVSTPADEYHGPPTYPETWRLVLRPSEGPPGTKVRVAQGGGEGYARIFHDQYVRVMFGELDLGTRPCGPGYLNEFDLDIPRLEPKAYQVKVTGTESGLELKGLFTITEPTQNEPPDE